jgi:hypothetical protein
VGSPGKSEWEGPAAQTGGGTIRKSPWLPAVFGAKGGLSGTGATIELSGAEKANEGREMLVDRRGERDGAVCEKEQHWSAHAMPTAPTPDSARLPVGRRDRPTDWMGTCRRAYPHIYRKKKEKKNKRRNGTGSAGMRRCLGRNAEVEGGVDAGALARSTGVQFTPSSPARGPLTDWDEIVQAHDGRAILQASPDELPDIDIHRL